MSIGFRIKEVRQDCNLSTREFATVLSSQGVKVDAGNLSRYENEVVKPSYEFFWAIHKACRVNLNWLIAGTGSKYMKLSSRKEAIC